MSTNTHFEVSPHYEGDPGRFVSNRSHHYILRFVLTFILPLHVVPFLIYYYKQHQKQKGQK